MFRYLEQITIRYHRQAGIWLCLTWFSARNAEQFTDAEYTGEFTSRWMLIALAKGVIGTWFVKRRVEKEAKAQRKINGWS